MSDPVFILIEEVERLHALSIARFGGTLGVRDPGGLEAAVEQPKHTHYYGRGDLFDIAAAYAYHIAQAQAFLDGNKRTAVAAAFAFLKINGVAAHFDWEGIYEAMIAIAEHRMDKQGLAAILRESAGLSGP
ncbi:MAG TPA: type II toxin-antitoxin system death-on-curing family toxin [Chthoniobacteraceae bacterium]